MAVVGVEFEKPSKIAKFRVCKFDKLSFVSPKGIESRYFPNEYENSLKFCDIFQIIFYFWF